jgi:hypothetical protein
MYYGAAPDIEEKVSQQSCRYFHIQSHVRVGAQNCHQKHIENQFQEFFSDWNFALNGICKSTITSSMDFSSISIHFCDFQIANVLQ